MKEGKRWGLKWELEGKISEEIFDLRTLLALQKLLMGKIKAIDYPISSGKEAVVFKGEGKEGLVAIKIYRPRSLFLMRGMKKYIQGDRRFDKLSLSKRDQILYTWARKERDNLARIAAAGVLVPTPIAVEKNVLVMSYIGDRESPAPLLKDLGTGGKSKKRINWFYLYERVTSYMSKMYEEGIVHGDLSEYNLMYWADKPWVIDVGQSVLISHPLAEELLKRDVERVASFFSKRLGELKGKKKIKIKGASDIIREVRGQE